MGQLVGTLWSACGAIGIISHDGLSFARYIAFELSEPLFYIKIDVKEIES